jgi:hypothetical protein
MGDTLLERKKKKVTKSLSFADSAVDKTTEQE